MSAKNTPKTPKTETTATPAVDVAKLVEQIKAAHAATVSAYRKSLDNAKRAGKLLKELKAHIDAPDSPYSWAKWVGPNTGISERTANNYMRVYEGWDKIDAAIKAGADSLTMTGALALLKGEGKGEAARSRSPRPPFGPSWPSTASAARSSSCWPCWRPSTSSPSWPTRRRASRANLSSSGASRREGGNSFRATTGRGFPHFSPLDWHGDLMRP